MSATATLPPPPQITTEATLEIFVHPSLRLHIDPGASGNTNTAYDAGDRLATVGGPILEAAYMVILFEKEPRMAATQLEGEFSNLSEQVEAWVEGYGWREKVRKGPQVELANPKDTRDLMNAYVGAVYVAGGFQAVHGWISQLLQF